MNVYHEMARHYDLIYCDEYDIDFYLLEAKNARGPVLEVACGTGRIMLRLQKEGIDISGLDLSKEMLDILKSNAKELGIAPTVYHANMVDFQLDRKFNLIIVPYRSFLHLHPDEREKALKNFHKHLNPGGRLIIHTYNVSEDEKNMTGDYHLFEHEDLEKNGKKYSIDWFLKYQSGSGSYRIVMILDGKELAYEMKIHYVSSKEMNGLLKKAAFRNIKQYCNFDYSPYNDGCSEVVWIADR
ncbi:class I SAM-dependent methyltransferase [Candidatus Micrarchaeota archaeon]|nr:class I SAM-dependent methyltransferase [Candidatus Micrarchaeota archaeon]